MVTLIFSNIKMEPDGESRMGKIVCVLNLIHTIIIPAL